MTSPQGSNDGTGHLYGTNTEAAVANFSVSGEQVDSRVITALAHLKASAALANGTLIGPPFTPELVEAIVAASDEVIAGGHDESFPVDVFQTGSGTSTNMNVNEVIATLASRRLGAPVHPNDHVNASQSTNDTFPTAIRIALSWAIENELIPALEQLERELALKARQFASVVKAGRTHLMDASPVMFGHELAGHRTQVHEAIVRLRVVLKDLAAVPLGGTATGNGLNTPNGYVDAVIGHAAERCKLPLREVRDHFAAQGAQDDLVAASAQLRGTAVAVFKIANDLRWSASGPHAGLGELHLAELQPGSSIMPGKVNPVGCEVLMQVCAQVMGNDAAVAFAGTQGNHQLNVFLPLLARNLLSSAELLTGAASRFAATVVLPMTVDLERCRAQAMASPALAAALNLELGYDRATKIVRDAETSGRTILEQVLASGALPEDDARRLLDVARIAEGVTSPFEGDIPFEDPDIDPSTVAAEDTGVVGPTPPSTEPG